jgi:hypothetical protein
MILKSQQLAVRIEKLLLADSNVRGDAQCCGGGHAVQCVTTRNRDLREISPVLGVCNVTSKESKREERGARARYRVCRARARSCDADVTTQCQRCCNIPNHSV